MKAKPMNDQIFLFIMTERERAAILAALRLTANRSELPDDEHYRWIANIETDDGRLPEFSNDDYWRLGDRFAKDSRIIPTKYGPDAETVASSNSVKT